MFRSLPVGSAMMAKHATVTSNRGSIATSRRGARVRPPRASANGEKPTAGDRHKRINPIFTYRLPRRQRAIMDLIEIDSEEAADRASHRRHATDRIKWANRLEELAAFYEEHGHSTPPSGTSLANWVKKMRTMRRREELSQDMILALNALDLDWEPSQTRTFARLKELQAFKNREGHVQVPVGGPLERWIRRMRALKRQEKLDRDILLELEKLGVVWEPTTVKRNQTDTTFQSRLDELKALVAADGRVKKTNQYDAGMRTWLCHQQRCFREGKLSKEKIQALRDVGVSLKMTQRVSWDTRLMELIEFKRSHGHCNVPATWRHNKELGSWVGTQRKYKRGGKLSEERVAALTSIGFEWEPKTALTRGLPSKASPWTVKAKRSKKGGPRVQIDWIGGKDKKRPKNDTYVWGRASANYEEKQQLVFEEIEKWWKDGASTPGSSRANIRGMRLNHRLNVGKNMSFKPDILLEIVSASAKQELIRWGLIVEVDEFSHRRGSKSYVNEEARMSELQKALAVPIKFVRFNPDPTEIDDRELEERTLELLEHLDQAITRAPIRELEVSYLAYD